MLNKIFNLCSDQLITNSTGVQALEQWMDTAYTYMAMLNYPYPTNFLENLPAWPANTSCIPLGNVSTSSTDE